MSDRELVLGRVRSALADVPVGEPPAWGEREDGDPEAAYIKRRAMSSGALADLFTQRCGEYRANVVRCHDDAASIAAAISDACARHGATELAIAPSLPLDWRPEGLVLVSDEPPLSIAELDRIDGAVTGCALAIALTGTIVLDGGAGQGRRALTLVPDLHICVVRGEQIVAGLPEAFAALDGLLRERRAIVLVSGPSATSDIELKRVEGVHGPRRLEVVVAA